MRSVPQGSAGTEGGGVGASCNPNPPCDPDHMRFRTWILPILFILVALVLSGGAFLVILSLTQKTIGSIDLNSQDLKVRLDELRATLQLLIVVAGLFTVAQGAAAFFNAMTFTKQADDAIKRIQDQTRDAESRFPMFARGEIVRREAYASLADIFRDPVFLDWRMSAYERLELLDRQKLLSVERFIGIELLPHPGGSVEYVRDLRRLANFYASKHRYESSRGQAQWTDLERSEYYLKLAIREAGDDNYHLITDLGVLYMEFHSPRRLDEAEMRFTESIRRMPAQQRAHYNLGVAARYRNQWEKTIEHYDEALQHQNWERRALDEMRCAILYNKACAFARFSKDDPLREEQLIRQCLETLKETALLGLVSPAVVDTDLTELDGAFAHLDSETKNRIREMKPSLTTKQVNRAQKLDLKHRIRAAADIMLGKA